jgi:hypothetical protein
MFDGRVIFFKNPDDSDCALDPADNRKAHRIGSPVRRELRALRARVSEIAVPRLGRSTALALSFENRS